MHRSKESGLIIASTIAAALTITGMAAADGTAKNGNQEKGQVVMRAEPTEVAIQGSTDQVKDLQRELASRGFYQGPIDGVPGAKTRAALRNFQIQQGIPVEGGLNAQTRDSLGLEWDRQPVKGTEEPARQPARGDAMQDQQQDRRREASVAQTRTSNIADPHAAARVQLSSLSGEHAKEVQQRLQKLGYYQGPIDGVFGASSRAALTRYFQHQAQLASQGMVEDSAIGAFGIEPSEVKHVSGTEVSGSATAGTQRGAVKSTGVVRTETPMQ